MRKNGAPIEYRYPPVTDEEFATVAAAYHRLTGRQIWPKMRGTFMVLMRTFGPELVTMMERDIEAHGVNDMLLRLRAAAAETSVSPGDEVRAARLPTPGPDDRIKEVNALLTGLRIDDLPDGLLEVRRLTTGMTEADRIRAAAERIRTMEPDAYDALVDHLAALKVEREAS